MEKKNLNYNSLLRIPPAVQTAIEVAKLAKAPWQYAAIENIYRMAGRKHHRCEHHEGEKFYATLGQTVLETDTC